MAPCATCSSATTPIAERRYAYARAAATDGDWSAAAEVLEQALELAPPCSRKGGGASPRNERLGPLERREHRIAASRNWLLVAPRAGACRNAIYVHHGQRPCYSRVCMVQIIGAE